MQDVNLATLNKPSTAFLGEPATVDNIDGLPLTNAAIGVATVGEPQVQTPADVEPEDPFAESYIDPEADLDADDEEDEDLDDDDIDEDDENL